MVRVVVLTRHSGTFGVPEGDFVRKREFEFTDSEIGVAEVLAAQMIRQPVPRVLRVEVDPRNTGSWDDITFEAERDLHDNVHWFIGPPPKRERN